VERFDARTGHEDDDRFVDMKYDTLRPPCIDRETRDDIRANRGAARRMLTKLNRAETFAERCEALSTGPVEPGFEQLQVDVLSAARFRQLRERYERLSGGITVEQRREVRVLLEQAKRTGDLTVDDILASVRCAHRKWLLSSPDF